MTIHRGTTGHKLSHKKSHRHSAEAHKKHVRQNIGKRFQDIFTLTPSKVLKGTLKKKRKDR